LAISASETETSARIARVAAASINQQMLLIVALIKGIYCLHGPPIAFMNEKTLMIIFISQRLVV